MTIIEQKAEALIERARIALEGASSEGPVLVAADIRAFLASYGGQLPQYLIDDLGTALERLEGRGPGPAEAQQSAALAGLKTWVSDDNSASVYWGNQAKETLSNLGAKVGEAIGAGADSAAGNALKSPTVVAVLIVAVVLGAAWAYRSFK